MRLIVLWECLSWRKTVGTTSMCRFIVFSFMLIMYIIYAPSRSFTYYAPSLRCMLSTLCAELVGVHSQYCKARVPLAHLSTLAPWHSAHAWMRWCLRVAPHASGESTLMWLNTGSSRMYACTKLHWWGVNAETCMYADGIYIYSFYLKKVATTACFIREEATWWFLSDEPPDDSSRMKQAVVTTFLR